MADMKKVPIPFPGDENYTQALCEAFDAISGRQIKDVVAEKNEPDRRALDDVVFDVLGLTVGEREAVYEAVVELVRRRLEKAKSI
jgi:hypothetical protein